MASEKAIELSQAINHKVQEMTGLCEGLDEAVASMAPKDRWSPKEIISHLVGPEEGGFVPVLEMVLSEDMPLLNVKPGNSHFTEKRAGTTFHELLGEFGSRYGSFVDRVAVLSDKQLARKAHVPLLKESPFGEYPTLEVFLQLMGLQHLGSHIDHMKEILALLEVSVKS